MSQVSARDSRVDAYIADAEPFARPIITHLRRLVWKGCPAVVETVKWNAPFFEFHGVLCGIAAFQRHARFFFWKGPLLVERDVAGSAALDTDQFRRITSVKDLPRADVIVGLVRAAAKLNADGVKMRRPKPSTSASVAMPPDLLSALKVDKVAFAAFHKLPPSHKREYIEWIAGTKTDATRNRRIAQAIGKIKAPK